MANGTIAFDTLSTSGQISGTAKSVDTDYLASGSAKCWLSFNGAATPPAIRSSFNVSSLTDNSVSDYTINIDNDMADANFAWSWGVRDGTTEGRGRFMNPRDNKILTASAFEIEFQNDDSNALNEPAIGCVIIHGDLA